MTTRYLLLVGALALLGSLNAQDQKPIVEKLHVTLEKSTGNFQLNFDVWDSEQQVVEIWLVHTDEQGKRRLLTPAEVSGDVGKNISIGKNKRIIWRHTEMEGELPKGSLQIVVDDGYKIPLESLLNQIDSNRLMKRMEALAIPRDHMSEEGQANLEKIKNDMESTFRAWGMKTGRQNISFGGMKGQNIMGDLTGLLDDGKKFLVFSNFDCVQHNLNTLLDANGMAGVLELLEILSDYSFRIGIRGIGFDFNFPEYVGSIRYVFHGGLSPDEAVVGSLNLNGLGNDIFKPSAFIDELKPYLLPGSEWVLAREYRGSFVFQVNNHLSKPLKNAFEENARRYVPDLQLVQLEVPKYGEEAFMTQNGDHAPFWYRNFPSLFITTGGIRERNDLESLPVKEGLKQVNSLQSITHILKAALATIADQAGLMHAATQEISLPEAKMP